MLLVVALITVALILTFRYFNKQSIFRTSLVMGAQLYRQNLKVEPNNEVQLHQDHEKYFRPSKLPILNNRVTDHNFLFEYQNEDPVAIKIPDAYYKSPEDTLINYFSFISDAENLIKGKSGGCGTVGSSKLPFPIAYTFFSPNYQKKMNYNQYIKSFEGIGHTNLIKYRNLPPDQIHPKFMRYFVELETIEGSDKGVTYFAYYYGYIYISRHAEKYLISEMMFNGEDFLCAPYHGWYHDAEANVSIRYGNWCKMIVTQYPTKQEGYVKKIYFLGKDGSNYMVEFMHLTNDTDVEVAQYKQADDGTWNVVNLNPEKCVEENQ
jgi:hypothetical protein